jgi:hypothetical protein
LFAVTAKAFVGAIIEMIRVIMEEVKVWRELYDPSIYGQGNDDVSSICSHILTREPMKGAGILTESALNDFIQGKFLSITHI